MVVCTTNNLSDTGLAAEIGPDLDRRYLSVDMTFQRLTCVGKVLLLVFQDRVQALVKGILTQQGNIVCR